MRRTPIKLMLDEHIWKGLTEVLSEHGHDVLHVVDTDYRGTLDEPLLAFAANQGRAVLTFNIRHFVPLVALWYETGREHAGVVLSRELPRGELLRRTERLLRALSAEELKDTARWLDEFKDDA